MTPLLMVFVFNNLLNLIFKLLVMLIGRLALMIDRCLLYMFLDHYSPINCMSLCFFMSLIYKF